MLQIITSPKQLDFSQILQVYRQSLQKSGAENYPQLDENRRLIEAEQDFYFYLLDFLKEPETFCTVWNVAGKYASVLRVEPYRDGVLIEGLETDPQFRKQGCAKNLLNRTLEHLNCNGICKVYAHISKENVASQKTHFSCGFCCIADYAAYIDGSVDYKSYTYLYKNDP